jgi:hypothetical protein
MINCKYELYYKIYLGQQDFIPRITYICYRLSTLQGKGIFLFSNTTILVITYLKLNPFPVTLIKQNRRQMLY